MSLSCDRLRPANYLQQRGKWRKLNTQTLKRSHPKKPFCSAERRISGQRSRGKLSKHFRDFRRNYSVEAMICTYTKSGMGDTGVFTLTLQEAVYTCLLSTGLGAALYWAFALRGYISKTGNSKSKGQPHASLRTLKSFEPEEILKDQVRPEQRVFLFCFETDLFVHTLACIWWVVTYRTINRLDF